MTTTSPLGYLITFHTYGTWLHGDERGSIVRDHNVPGTPVYRPHEGHRRASARILVSTPVTFGPEERRVVDRTIEEVCSFRGWAKLALNVRTEHVHVVASGDAPPESMMSAFKAWSTRRLREAQLATGTARIWSRHGSARYLWQRRAVEAACWYVLKGQ